MGVAVGVAVAVAVRVGVGVLVAVAVWVGGTAVAVCVAVAVRVGVMRSAGDGGKVALAAGNWAREKGVGVTTAVAWQAASQPDRNSR
jgi:hypothetical protein